MFLKIAKDSNSSKPGKKKYFFHQLLMRRKDKTREGREVRVREGRNQHLSTGIIFKIMFFLGRGSLYIFHFNILRWMIGLEDKCHVKVLILFNNKVIDTFRLLR